jgi:hypothetical protein
MGRPSSPRYGASARAVLQPGHNAGELGISPIPIDLWAVRVLLAAIFMNAQGRIEID